MNYFEYNGIRSCDLGLRIQRKDVFSAPKYAVSFESIPGRHGDLILPGGRYPNAQVTYTVFLPAGSMQELADKITAVKAWLYADPDQYHELRDTYDSRFFRKAVFASKLNIDDELGRIGTFTVSFSCLPFRYDAAGQEPVNILNGDSLVNPYPFASRPLIRIEGNGPGTLTIQSASHTAVWVVTELTQHLDVDSEQMNFYKGSTPKNDVVSGSGFPLLYPGSNTFSFTGFKDLIVKPRWCTL